MITPEIQISLKPVPLDVTLDNTFRQAAIKMEAMYRAAPTTYMALQKAAERMENAARVYADMQPDGCQWTEWAAECRAALAAAEG